MSVTRQVTVHGSPSLLGAKPSNLFVVKIPSVSKRRLLKRTLSHELENDLSSRK